MFSLFITSYVPLFAIVIGKQIKEEERRDRYLFQIEYEQLDKRMKYEV